jgi:hypothetical protein
MNKSQYQSVVRKSRLWHLGYKIRNAFEGLSLNRGADYSPAAQLVKNASLPEDTSWDRSDRIERRVREMVDAAGIRHDEHGTYERGDHMLLRVCDYIDGYAARRRPFLSMSSTYEGLALIKITRKRVYAKSSTWSPSEVSCKYLIGKNEAGTWFSHPVHPTCQTILDAINWMWDGRADEIIARQGDIASTERRSRPRLPKGHDLDADGRVVLHRTHAALVVPQGGGWIVARRWNDSKIKQARSD